MCPSPDELDAASKQQTMPDLTGSPTKVEPSASRDGFLPQSQSDQFKPALYDYLKKQMARRAEARDPSVYEDRTQEGRDEESRYGKMSFMNALSNGAAGLGQVYGTQAKGGVIDPLNQSLHKGYEDRVRDDLNQNESEEQQVGTDLNIGKTIMGGEEKEKQRKDTVRDRQAQRDYLYDKLRTDYAEKMGKPGAKAAPGAKGTQFRESQFEAPGGGPMVFDPSTGSYNAPAVPDGVKRHEKPAAQKLPGQTKYQQLHGATGPNGEPLFVDPTDPTKTISTPLPPGAKHDQKPEKETDAQRNAAMMYNNAANALTTLEQMEAKGYRPSATTGLKDMLVPDAMSGFAYTDDEQKYRQAAEDWTAAKLRLESGAAIPLSEIKQQARIYMVKPGESEQAIKQKQAARRSAMTGLQYKAAKGADEIRALDAQNQQSGSGGGGGGGAGEQVIQGVRYRKDPDSGKWKKVQ